MRKTQTGSLPKKLPISRLFKAIYLLSTGLAKNPELASNHSI